MSFPQEPGGNLQISPGRGGWVRIEPHLYVSNADNQIGEDIISDIIDLSVSHDLTRSSIRALLALLASGGTFSGGGTWILEGTLSIDRWQTLRPFVDWLSPVLTVWYADGSSLTKQLGHYLLLDSPEERSEIGGTVRLDARDVLWVLSKQGISDILIAPVSTTPMPPVLIINPGQPPAPPAGTLVNWGAKIKEVIAGAVVPGGDATSHLRETVPGPAVNAYVGLDGPIFDIKTPRLDVCNALLLGAEWFPLHVTETGVISTQPLTSVYYTTPIRRWLANPPAGPFMLGTEIVDPSPRERERSPIAETIQSTPATAQTIEEVIVTGGITTPVVASATIASSFSTGHYGGDLARTLGGSRRAFHASTVTSPTAAQSLANWLLEQALTENTAMTINVEPDPSFIAIHANVTLGIWDAAGRQIANGTYAVNRVKYGMLPESPLMQIDVAAFDNFIPATPSTPQQ